MLNIINTSEKCKTKPQWDVTYIPPIPANAKSDKTILRVNKDVEQMESHILLVGKWNGTVTLGNSLTLSYKGEHTPTTWLSSSTSKYLPKRKHTCPHNDFYVNVHDSFIHKQSKYPSTSEQINKSRYSHTMEHYSSTKRNELLVYLTTRMQLKSMLSEGSQTQKSTYSRIPFVWTFAEKRLQGGKDLSWETYYKAVVIIQVDDGMA